ncbi:MAG TPA: ATP synthase F1 subunit gamma [Vicinamibacterales bacterium]|nr:ATP synthase F1 subunit gamma [Vicinamibacterales bacterium]
MPSLIDIRRRIRSTKSTQQITKAMKMVSSSKLRRAQERIVNSRPYAHEMLRIFNNLATRVDPATHPLLNDEPKPGRTLLIVITADRGLCGGFNANVIKTAAHFLAERQAGTAANQESYANREVALALVGRKGRDFFMRRGFDVRYEEVNLFTDLKWSHAQAIAKTAIDEFLSPDVSSVYLVYNEFRSVISQRVVIERLLPIPKLAPESAAINTVDYLFEPSPQELLSILLPYHVAVQVARALLESSAAEHAARMTAMDSATRNAKDMVDRLTLYMNKVRQASITREIIEIVAGAQSV